MFKKIIRGISGLVRSGMIAIAPKQESSFFFVSLLILSGLVMIGFIPMFGVNGLFAKNLILPLFSGIFLIMIAAQALKKGSFTLLESKTSMVLFGSILGMLIVSIFSVTKKSALFGTFGETPSFLLLLSLAIIFYVSAISFKKFSNILGLLLVITMIYGITFLHVMLRIIFGANFLSFGFMNSLTTTLVGSWTDFAIFSVLLLVMSVVCFEIGRFTKIARIIALVIGIMAMIGLFLVNMQWIWILSAGILLGFAVYVFSVAYWDPETSSYAPSRTIPWFTIILFITSLIGLMFGGFITRVIENYRPIGYREIYPNMQATFKATLKNFNERPLTGVGLDNFDHVWNLAKPVNLSGTSSGSIEFTTGYSFLTTIIATTGLLGILVVIALALLFIRQWIMIIRSEFTSIQNRFMISLVAISVLITTIVIIIDYPGISVLVIWAILLGIFYRLSSNHQEKTISFVHDPRTSFFGMITVITLVAIGLSGIYISLRKTASVSAYSKSLRAFTVTKDQNKGITQLVRANQLWSSDFYHRTLSSQVISQLQQLGNRQDISKELFAQEVQRVLSIGVSYAQAAVNENPKNYRNWVTLGNAYQFFANLKVEGANEKAKEAYTKAVELSPNDRTLDLLFANNILSAGDRDMAIKLVNDSLNKYPTRDGYTWLYNQNISEKSFDTAAQNLVRAIQLDTTNYGLINEFGLLMFTQGKFKESAAAFEQSLLIYRIQPAVFAYLAVSYESVGKTEQANQVINFLTQQLPDTAEKLINEARLKKGFLNNANVPAVTPDSETTNTSTNSQ